MKAFLFLTCLVTTSVFAGGFDSCKTIFLNKVDYNIPHTQELCNDEFATLYSDDTKTPLFSYEHHDTATQVKRSGKFHVDNRIPKPYQSIDSDYVNSGYDRGHIAPSGDMENQKAQDQSFQFSNIAPQSSKLNEIKWRILESQYRGSHYIITGVVFQNKSKFVGNHVIVPTQFYKIVTDGKCSSAFIADNKDDADIKTTTVQSIENLTKIKFNVPYNACKK